MLQAVGDGDERIYFHRLTVEKRRPVTPLAYGVQGGLQKERIAAYHLQRLYGAVCGDNCSQFHATFAMDLFRERGIARLDAPDQHRLFQMRHMQPRWRLGTHVCRAFWLAPGVINAYAGEGLEAFSSVRLANAWNWIRLRSVVNRGGMARKNW